MDRLKIGQYNLLPSDKLPDDIGDPKELIKKITKKVTIDPMSKNLNSVFQWTNLAETALKKYSGVDKKMTAKLEFELGCVYLDSLDYKKSNKMMKSAAEKYFKQKPVNKKMLSACFRYLSIVQIGLEEYDNARMDIEKAIEMDKENYKNYYSVANIFAKMDEKEKAEEQYKKAIEICIRNNGNEHMETASFYNGYGIFLLQTGSLESAEEYLYKSYHLMNSYYGEGHLYTARCLGHIGIMLFEKKNYEESFEAMKKALISIEKILGKNEETLIIKKNCADILHAKVLGLESYDNKLERICILIVSRKELYVALEYKRKISIAPKLVLKGTDFGNIIFDCKQRNIAVKYNKKQQELFTKRQK
jgi:tetratricopeptide (TPR) repeat protein